MSDSQHTHITPISPEQRVFTTASHASLWFSLGVGLLVIQIGAYLVPAMGTRDAFIAVLVGSLVGAGLLAWTAKIGCELGLSSAGLMQLVYGTRFAKLPIVLNIIQLVGWTTFELVVMRDGTQAITQQLFDTPVHAYAATLLWGGVLAILMLSAMLTLVRQFVSRIGLPLVVLSLCWLSWHFYGVLQTQGVEAFWTREGTGEMSMLSAIDLVMAMPVSWLPLVADYARHGKSGNSTLRGTWIGYAIANAWCYALGILVVSVSEPDTNLVTALLLAQGGLLSLGLILMDEIDNAYGDVYSGAVCANSLNASVSVRTWGIGIAIVCTVLALVLPMHDLEPFLLLLSSIFVPLYGVILGRLSFVPAQSYAITQHHFKPILIWAIGIAAFHLSSIVTPQFGSAIPSLVLTFALSVLDALASHKRLS
jgi:NCS1 family nucleobase:cation symporter-1